jgi:hypothetical protein
MEFGTETPSEIARTTDKILMCLVSSSRPEEAIYRHYEEAKDKDIFVAGLVGTLLLRHRQWQGLQKN